MSGSLDATILIEDVPEVEVIDGLVYITDRIGGLVIRRCFRPGTFVRAIAEYASVARKLDVLRRAGTGSGVVVPLRHAASPDRP
jgi:hypothetical protein